MLIRKRYCTVGHIIDGWRRGAGGHWRRYCRQCNVLAVARWRERARARRMAERANLACQPFNA